MIEILIGAAIAAYIYYKKSNYNDSEWAKNLMVGKNEAQKAVIRYFCNEPGFLSKKPISDEEYDEMVEIVLNSNDFKKMGLEKIGLDEDELKEIEPVHFGGYLFDKNVLSKQGDDGKWRSSKYQVSWLFFSVNQVFLYQYTFNMDEDGKKESTEEYFYKDITSFSASSDTVETNVYGDFVSIDSNRFTITVPGDKLYCSLEQSDYTEQAIQGMRSLLRDKKNNG